MKTKPFFQTTVGLILSLILCPPFAIYLLLRYDYLIGKGWERALGVAAGCYIAVVGFCITSGIEAHACSITMARVAQQEAALVTVERDMPAYVVDCPMLAER